MRPTIPTCLGAFLLVFATTLSAAPPASVELLQLPAARIEESTASPNETLGLKSLADNDPRSIAVATVEEGKTLDVVYSFGELTVTPQKVVVRLPERMPPQAAIAGIEVLASTVSPRAGFRLLGGGKLETKAAPQDFKLQSAGARWIMLRFVPLKGTPRVAVADVSLTGNEGPPESEYLFAQSPAKALDVLKGLKQMKGIAVGLTADEASLFADCEDGKLDQWSFGEAALVVSGVTEAAARKPLVEKLEKIAADAGPATQAGKTPFKKGEQLLKWLHSKGHLRKYSTLQTDLTPVLEQGTFNCVSSAVLYNVVARKLGLDVKGIEVPDHAFTILYDGSQHADVETTNKEGFAPTREKLAEFERETGFVYTTDRRNRREVGETGLLALVAYNHGVDHGQEKRYPQALAAYFRAMSLDRECASAVKGALGTLANWSIHLSKEGQFAEAVGVLATAAELAPQDAKIRNNRVAVWRQWADAEAKAGHKGEALAILRRAAGELADEDFSAAEMWVFAAEGEELAKAGEWEKALQAVEPGFTSLSGKPLAELTTWRTGMLGRWFNSHVRVGEYEAAAAAIERAVKLVPDEKRFANNLGYLVQEWTRAARKEGKPAEAEQAIAKLIARHPNVPELQKALLAHFYRHVDDLVTEAKYAEAVAAAERSRGALGDAEAIRKLEVHSYNQWAAQFRNKKAWQESIDVYVKALEKLPQDKTLLNNEQATWFQWADSHAKVKDWPAAIAVYEKALARHPGQKVFETNLKLCRENLSP